MPATKSSGYPRPKAEPRSGRKGSRDQAPLPGHRLRRLAQPLAPPSAFGLGQPGGYAAGASRSGDMSDCEAEWESGLFTIPFSNSNSELELITSFLELEL